MNAPQKLEKPRARKEAAKMLGIALQNRLRRLYEAQQENDPDKITVASCDLAQCMNENLEFVIWALKHLGGLNPPPPQSLRTISKPTDEQPGQPNHFYRKPPAPVLQPEVELPNVCTCPPLEHGIIGRERHMVSCPKFIP